MADSLRLTARKSHAIQRRPRFARTRISQVNGNRRRGGGTPPRARHGSIQHKGMAAAIFDDYDDDDVDARLSMLDFYKSRAGVRGLVESGVTTVPPPFLTPAAWTSSSSASAMVAPTVDLSLPRSHAVALVGAAARSCGFFQVTNHGVPAGTVESALSAVRAFNEQPGAARSAYYSETITGTEPAVYTTIGIPPPNAGQAANGPLLPWRDTLHLRFCHGDKSQYRLPAACVDALLEYRRSLTALGKVIADLLSEALGVGVEQLDRAVQVAATLMQCHYYPPCPRPERVAGSRIHTDGDLFTVLAQDAIGGLQVRLDGHGDAWVDVVPVTGALLINIGDILKVVSNDEYKSVEHRVVIKSTQEARVSIALFFTPAKCGDSDFFGPMTELVTQQRPARYRSLTWPQLVRYRTQLGHARISLDKFKANLN